MVPGAFIQCCEPSATRVSCELPILSATPSSREQLPGSDHHDKARLWGSAQEWHIHWPDGVAGRKNIFSAERIKMYPFAGSG